MDVIKTVAKLLTTSETPTPRIPPQQTVVVS